MNVALRRFPVEGGGPQRFLTPSSSWVLYNFRAYPMDEKALPAARFPFQYHIFSSEFVLAIS